MKKNDVSYSRLEYALSLQTGEKTYCVEIFPSNEWAGKFMRQCCFTRKPEKPCRWNTKIEVILVNNINIFGNIFQLFDENLNQDQKS